MPTYQYACTEAECGHAFEQFQSFSDESLTVCPQCQGRLRKVFNAVGVVFKGSGFYRTDSRADGRKDASSSSAGSDGAGSGSKDGASTSSSTTNGSANGSTSSSSTSGSTGTSSTSTAPAGAGAA